MKLCIRGHDLGVTGSADILKRLDQLGLDGVQMVCYRVYDNIEYLPGSITPEKAASIGNAFSAAGKHIPYVGAYFNPVHSDKTYVENAISIFSDYLRNCKAMGCDVVGSETGSYNNGAWIYHPRNRTEEALQSVVSTFSQLCDVAADCGTTVAMEGAAGHVCWDVDTLARARKMMNRQTKVVFDLYNFLDESNQGDYLKILEKGLDTFGDDILLFHMKDCNFVNGGKPIQTQFGQGQMDMTAILRMIKGHNPNAIMVFEETVDPHIEYAINTIRNIWESI